MKNVLKILGIIALAAIIGFTMVSCGGGGGGEGPTGSGTPSQQTTKLKYLGHASLRLTSKNGTVVYVDPYEETGDYNVPADIILSTHAHYDHSDIHVVAQKASCVTITWAEAQPTNGDYKTFTEKGITIKAVAAYNESHQKDECVGYIITIDGIKVYAAGDTGRITEMQSFPSENINYAFLPCDKYATMTPDDAAKCAEDINAKHNIPYHTNVETDHLVMDVDNTNEFMSKAPNSMKLTVGQEITLVQN